MTIAESFTLLRQYDARSSGTHLTDLARRLISAPERRPALLAALTELKSDASLLEHDEARPPR